MNNSYGIYAVINGNLMCFATEAERDEYVKESANEQDSEENS